LSVRILVIAVVLAAASTAARATEIDAFISTAVKAATDELLPPFERANGASIRASYAPSGALIPKFERGEPVDIFVTDSVAIDKLIGAGKIAGARTDIVRTGIGICVRKGAAKPDVATAEAFKRALLAAKSVAYASPAGGSITGPHIQAVFERLGIAEQMAGKTRFAAGGPNGRVSVVVGSGEAEIGLQQVSELMSNPDVEVIGMLPADLQQITLYSAAITASAKEGEAARAMIKALTAPDAAPIYKARGLEPL
jgi:molybdate transport system substrate-binding protein